jgi:hypothetical protein
MLLVREASDIHLEFERYKNGVRALPDYYFSLPKLPFDHETVLILAGDIGVIDRPYTIIPFLEEVCPRFKAVIYVPGNHELYGASITTAYGKFRELAQHTGVFFLQNDSVKIDDVTFIGSTMWTNYNNANHSDMITAQMGVYDHKTIRTGTMSEPYLRKFLPGDAYVRHLDAVAFIESQLIEVKLKKDEKAVVITHHAPSFKSVHTKFHGDQYNSAYYSNLDELVLKYEPDFWFHGHMHDSSDYMIGNTRVICNPRGYQPNELNPGWNSELLIRV